MLEWVLILLSPALVVALVAGVRRLTRSKLTRERRGVWGRGLVGFGAPSFIALAVAIRFSPNDNPFLRVALAIGCLLCIAAIFGGAALLESRRDVGPARR
ncbi:MAG: hypothetical protein KUG77_28780 [Nannocystaceae bacterium]|nr:hypothetical protein [Nannocystaceae bacterium]